MGPGTCPRNDKTIDHICDRRIIWIAVVVFYSSWILVGWYEWRLLCAFRCSYCEPFYQFRQYENRILDTSVDNFIADALFGFERNLLWVEHVCIETETVEQFDVSSIVSFYDGQL